MGTAFLYGNGGGTGKAFAAISVTYPVGSICTATNGRKTVKAKDTTGKWLCFIPEDGEWIITATNGSISTSQRVFVESRTTYTVKLAFGKLFENGDQFDYVTGGWQCINAYDSQCQLGTMTIGNDIRVSLGSGANQAAFASPKNRIDLTEYNTLRIHVSDSNQNPPWIYVYISSVNNTTMRTNNVASFGGNSTIGGNIEIDISKITGSYYIAIGAAHFASATALWYAFSTIELL